jgi:aspartyl-tRNA(Asn)/glutamyl-tRNA(Gln) amidotransferase subunit A
MAVPPGPTIEEFGRKLRRGETTAEAATAACLERIDAHNQELRALILVMRDEALEQARQADRDLAAGRDRGPLHGVPITIKDLVDVRGTPTTAASRVREHHLAREDAPVVSRVREAGAVIVGKANLHEFAFGTTNEDSAFGAARNPIDPSRSPGGSSGGSAAGIVAGMALASIGTDTGGSIRIPAAACGIVGLKPTLGELPLVGVVPLSRTLDHLGPLARTVADTWILYRALAGKPVADPAVRPRTVRGLRLAVPRRYFCDALEDGVRERFEAAVAALRQAGAVVTDAEIPAAPDGAAIYLHIVLSEAAAYHAATLEAIPHRYSTAVRERLEMGRYVLAEDYLRALAGRDVLSRQVDAALAPVDALVLPTLPIVAPTIGAATARVGDGEQPVRNLMLRLTQTFNLSGHPALSLPCGQTPAGLPCGLQMVGQRGQTERLLETAAGIERHLG